MQAGGELERAVGPLLRVLLDLSQVSTGWKDRLLLGGLRGEALEGTGVKG